MINISDLVNTGVLFTILFVIAAMLIYIALQRDKKEEIHRKAK